MAKTKTRFVCQQCGFQSPKWLGKCPDCGAWNALVEEVVAAEPSGTVKSKQTRIASQEQVKPTKISEINSASVTRIDTGNSELNRVLGGGLVPGELILLSGDPGIGKSTITMQIMDSLAGNGDILYISGEESKGQIASRAERLGVHNERIHLVTENNMEVLDHFVKQYKLDLLILDSVQTVFDPEIQSATGSVSQLRAVTSYCMTWSKGLGIPTILIGHVTKDGNVAGPRVLEHMVDAVLYLEGDRQSQYRILRGLKNRFGSTNEIGIFDMTDKGLVAVENPSLAFLSERMPDVSGSSTTVALEGTRPLLVEIQALVTKSFFGQPRCVTTGARYDRVAMLMAVLEKRCGLRLNDQDVYLNIVGGIRIDEPACDLAMAMAIASCYTDRSIPIETILVGEIGLTGELRPVAQLERRVQEAARTGFTVAIVPKQTKPLSVPGIQIIEAATVSDVIQKLWRG